MNDQCRFRISEIQKPTTMLKAKFPSAHHFTVSLFGCQYHAKIPNLEKGALIAHFDSLVKLSALRVEELQQDDPPTKIWMTYWASPQTFKAWWESSEVVSFWTLLTPEDAGFWRETMSLPATRAMYMSNKDWPAGFGSCGELEPLTGRSGYWGAYRSRLTPDGPDDRFASVLDEVPPPKSMGKVRAGRMRMTSFPDNMCYVVEGQDYSAMGEKEEGYWDENLAALAKEWITTVLNGGPSHGLLSARGCQALNENPRPINGTPVAPIPTSLNHKRQAQLLFWLDLAKMEVMGKTDETHVKLRQKFVEAGRPGGGMYGGDLMLWVDMGVLKGEELDAEYIGCYDGTGFLAYDHHPSFMSAMVEDHAILKLPSFFDKPVASYPEEW